MTSMEMLIWARGTGLQFALAIFVLGTTMRLLQIWLLGKKTDLSEARAAARPAAWRTLWRRTLPPQGMLQRSPVVYIGGYLFHVGLFLTLFFFAPHILLFKGLWGFSWPALPFFLIDAVTLISIAALIVLLVHRLVNPVRRFLSTFQDYFTWVVTILPLLTGYLAYHRMLLPYNTMLAWHILSVELLLIVIPFTKLIHTFTFLLSRWYNGVAAGRKGVQV